MSVRVMSQVWETSLPTMAKLVLLALADCANDEGLAWPSIATIAKKCGCDERTVQRNIRTLESCGFVKRTEVVGRGCLYQIDVRQSATPGRKSPAAESPKTPGRAPPNPSGTIIKTKKVRAGELHELPVGWEPRPFGEGSKSRKIEDGWPPGERESQLEHFAAHHRSRGSKFKDWQEAWSTWVLNSEKFNRNRNNDNRKPSSNDEIQNPYVRVAARRQAERSAAGAGAG